MNTHKAPTGAALWWQAIRPKTLAMAISPVIVGSVLGWAHGRQIQHWEVPFITIVCTIAIQAGTNLFNDVGDYLNGTDDGERLGPPRVTALGWALPHQVSTAALVAFLAALVVGVYLTTLGGWPICFLGLASLGAGYLYSHGPLPVSRTPMGEVVVLVFFGIAAVVGTFYLITGTVSAQVTLWGVVMGLPASAVLLLNNVRDMHGDALAGRQTLAIFMGLKRSRLLYAGLLIAPYIMVAGMVAAHWVGGGVLLVVFSAPLAWKAISAFRHTEPSLAMNPLLGQTVRFQGVFAVCASVGIILTAS